MREEKRATSGERQERADALSVIDLLLAKGDSRWGRHEKPVRQKMPYGLFLFTGLVAVPSLYTGYTSDLRRRLGEHNSGKTSSITYRIPFD